MFSVLRTIWLVFLHAFQKEDYGSISEEKPYLAHDIAAGSFCRATLMERALRGMQSVAVACPVGCIALQATEDETGRPSTRVLPHQFLALHLLRLCEEAALLTPIQLDARLRNGS